MSSVQKLGGTVIFFTITAAHGSLKSARERGYVFICNLHNLPNHIQPMLMHVIASLGNPPTIVPTGRKTDQIHRD